MARLVISIPLADLDDFGLGEALEILEDINGRVGPIAEVSLTRDGDRSGGNLLLPKLNGRFGSHYQSRKAKLDEVLKDK